MDANECDRGRTSRIGCSRGENQDRLKHVVAAVFVLRTWVLPNAHITPYTGPCDLCHDASRGQPHDWPTACCVLEEAVEIMFAGKRKRKFCLLLTVLQITIPPDNYPHAL